MTSNRLSILLAAVWAVYVVAALALDRLGRAFTGSASAGWAPFLSLLFYLLLLPTLRLVWNERRRWKEMLLFALSSIFALAMGQVFIALFHPELNLPDLAAVRERRHHHINPPNERLVQGVSGDKQLVIETNPDGFRTSYTRESFRNHSVRVAILGDSYPFGFGVENEDSLPFVLETLLRGELGLDAAVLNCGVISYSPFLESILFEEIVSRYRPTHTLLYLDPTDIGDDLRYLSEAVFKDGEAVFEQRGNAPFRYWGFVFESFLQPVLIRPAVLPWQALAVAWGRLDPPRDSSLYRTEAVIDGERVSDRFFIYRFPLEKTRPYFEQTYSMIEKIARQAEAVGSRFALVVTPRYHHWSDQECPDNWETHEYREDEPFQFEYFRFFEEKAPDAPFPVLQLLPDFQETDRFPLVFRNDPHWNPEGHRFVAERTLDFLKSTYFPHD